MTEGMQKREFRLPDLGEGLTESDLVSWHVKVGDRVELNEVIAEVETAKALVDIPSPFAGVVAALHAEPGETVEVGEPLVTFDVSVVEPVEASPVVEPVAADNLVVEPVETTTPPVVEPVETTGTEEV
jgi:2-oxoisovalerate dehydrogenase E2 component (dihydrolipoyl transacylase)